LLKVHHTLIRGLARNAKNRLIRESALLHCDDNHAPLGPGIVLLVIARVASRPVSGLVWDGQLKLGPFAATAFFLFASSDLIDDPGLKHG
jgi:hypothetical protein